MDSLIRLPVLSGGTIKVTVDVDDPILILSSSGAVHSMTVLINPRDYFEVTCIY